MLMKVTLIYIMQHSLYYFYRQVLYIPSEFSLHVYDRLMNHGQNYGMRNAGYYSLRSLRIEKFFLYWGQDIDSGFVHLGADKS